MRWYRALVFRIERLILKGASFQLLLIGALIVLVSLGAGAILVFTGKGDGGFLESAWWGFLRLSDPGYLGDDEGVIRRSLSTVVTILGYVLFMGALVATMTQGLYRTMARLESGLTPITQRGHILILGWTNRTPAIVREILLAEGRVKRFLRRVGVSRLNIVILAEKVSTSLVMDLKTELGPLWEPGKITFRSGNPLKMDHLERVDYLNASAVILPASELELSRGDSFDARVIKVLLSISRASQSRPDRQRPPLLVTEVHDPRKAGLLEGGYGGEIKILPSSLVISRLIAQNVRHSGLSFVYSELLNHARGSEIYLREIPELIGWSFRELGALFPRAIVLGVVRQDEDGERPCLNPPDDFELATGDRLVFIARDYEGTRCQKKYRRGAPCPPSVPIPVREQPPRGRKLLLLGWSSKVPILLNEFDSYAREAFEIHLVSVVPTATRQRVMELFGCTPEKISLRHIETDYTSPSGLEALNLRQYDNVVFLSSDWRQSETQSDARIILGYQLLKAALQKLGHRPDIVVELMDDENEALFPGQSGEVLVSPLIVSHMLGHTALRPELAMVFEELFTAGGAEIFFRRPEIYLDDAGTEQSFETICSEVRARGDIALGIYRAEALEGTERLQLNPDRDSRWTLRPSDRVVVLTTYESPAERALSRGEA